MANLGRIAPRDREAVFIPPVVIASESGRSRIPETPMILATPLGRFHNVNLPLSWWDLNCARRPLRLMVARSGAAIEAG